MSLHDIWRGDVMPSSGVTVSIGRNTFDPPAPAVPIFSAHSKQLILHDSGTKTGSGILTYNSNNNRLELIASNSGAYGLVPAIFWDGYDNTGGLSLSGSPTTIGLTQRASSHSNIFVLANNIVQINMAGAYEITFRGSADQTSSATRITMRYFVEEAAAGNLFSEVPGTRAWSYNRNNTDGEGTAGGTFIRGGVNVGHRFRLAAQQETSPVQTGVVTLSEGSALTIRRLQ